MLLDPFGGADLRSIPIAQVFSSNLSLHAHLRLDEKT